MCRLLVRESKLSGTNILTVRSLFWHLTVSLICHWLVLIVTVWHHNVQNTLSDINTLINTLCTETESNELQSVFTLLMCLKRSTKYDPVIRQADQWCHQWCHQWFHWFLALCFLREPPAGLRSAWSELFAGRTLSPGGRRTPSDWREFVSSQVEIIFMMENIWLYLIHSFSGCIEFQFESTDEVRWFIDISDSTEQQIHVRFTRAAGRLCNKKTFG